MQSKEVTMVMEEQPQEQNHFYYSTSESSSEEERVIPVLTSTLKKSSADLSKESERVRGKLQSEVTQLSQEERGLLDKEITLLQQGTHPKLIKKMNRLKEEYEKDLKVAERRKEYELQAALNQYDCMRQRIDLEYQASLREIRDEVLMTRKKPTTPVVLLPGKRKSREEVLLENAGDEDLNEINRLLQTQVEQSAE